MVGDAGVGKTTLCSLLCSGGPGEAQPPLGRSPARTQGVDVHVRLVYAPGADGGAARPQFVELWDVSGDAEAYGPLLPLLLSAQPAAGVLLCHDLTRRRGAASVARWAAELGRSASFASPRTPGSPTAGSHSTRLRELGVPVPVLVLGLKADAAELRERAEAARTRARADPFTRLLAASSRLLHLLQQALARALRLSSESGPGVDEACSPRSRPPHARDEALFSADTHRCAAAVGRLDFDVFDAFFAQLLAHYDPLAAANEMGFAFSSSERLRDAGAVSSPAALPRWGHKRSASGGAEGGGASAARGADEDGRLAWEDGAEDVEGGGKRWS